MNFLADNFIRVTVIDDDVDDYTIICGLLKGVGFNHYETEWISRSVDALPCIKAQESDVYLIDYRLGEKTGLDILEELKGSGVTRPMILLTGTPDRSVDILSMEKGASDFLEKGLLTSQQLERSIRYSIRRAADLIEIRKSDRMQLQKDSAEAATAAKSRFLANMSHELRTPLTAVLGFTELAKNPEIKDFERSKFLNTISQSGEHLLRVINDILELSKIEDGHFQADVTPFSLSESLENVFDVMNSAALLKGLELSIQIPENCGAARGADALRFKQILFNMVGNAIKFTKVGSVKIKLSLCTLEQMYIVRVEDTGLGITSAERDRLFQPYSQANSETSKQFGGTGLGLDLSRMLARALGGELLLEKSEVNFGSTFSLKLPLSRGEMPNVCANSVLPQVEGSLPSFHEMRVLVADDSLDNQTLIQHFLKNIGLNLTFVSNGQEALGAVGESEYDAVLMDMQMPKMGGYEATGILRERGFDKPIIALTAHAFSEERDRAMNSGFTDFVSKPINRKLLISALKRAEPGTARARSVAIPVN